MRNSKGPYIEHTSRKTHFIVKIAFFLIAVLIVVAVIKIVRKYNEDADDKRGTQTVTDKSVKELATGSVLHGQYFDVAIDKAFSSESNPGNNETMSLPKEEGSQYFIIGLAVKNTDTEKRMMPDGRLQIENGADEMKFDNDAIAIAEGGILTESIEPGITKKGKIVYRIPAGVKGKVYYYPDVDNNSNRIFLLSL